MFVCKSNPFLWKEKNLLEMEGTMSIVRGTKSFCFLDFTDAIMYYQGKKKVNSMQMLIVRLLRYQSVISHNSRCFSFQEIV